MNYTPDEVMEYISEEDVKFVRMAFCDIFGRQRNVAIMAGELPRAFEHGIAFDASAVAGFEMDVRSDLFLRPDASTLKELPWRPQHGRVAHMFCDVVHPDGTPCASDLRALLRRTAEEAAVMPFPRPDTTPPVTKIYFAMITTLSKQKERQRRAENLRDAVVSQ